MSIRSKLSFKRPSADFGLGGAFGLRRLHLTGWVLDSLAVGTTSLFIAENEQTEPLNQLWKQKTEMNQNHKTRKAKTKRRNRVVGGHCRLAQTAAFRIRSTIPKLSRRTSLTKASKTKKTDLAN